MILPADKGRCMVVMDETEYHAKVDSLHLLLQWDSVPADLWYSNGVTGVGGCSEHCYGTH